MVAIQNDKQIRSWTLDSVNLTNEIVGNSPYFIIVTDFSGNVTFINNSASILFNVDNKTASGKNINEIMVASQNRNIFDQISGHLLSGNAWNGEVWVTLTDKTERLIELHATRMHLKADGSGETDFILYMGRNITVEKSAERQEIQVENRAVRGDMAGEIAHELNNYLSVVYGNLELLGMALEKGSYQNLSGRVKSMKDGLDRITKFVEGLMSIPRQETLKEPIDIYQFIRSEITMIRALPQFEEIEFVYHFENELSRIEADKRQLRQAITLIINNAYDALAKKGSQDKKITISTSFSSTDNRLRIEISDNGCGMRDEDYGRLFKQLFTTKDAGHGFNLLTVKRIIKGNGGNIKACKGPENGASFVIELPCSDQRP